MLTTLRTMLIAAALAAALLLACGGDDEITTPTPVVNDTPANCLKVVEGSWNSRDYHRYRATLSPNFVFYFNPNDIGDDVEGYIIPVSWDYVEMNAAIQHMFNEAYSIKISIPTSGVGTPGDEDTIWHAENVNIGFELLTSPGNGWRIGAGYCNFEFEKYEDNGADHWRLTKWWDYTREARAAASIPGLAPASLGRVLAFFN